MRKLREVIESLVALSLGGIAAFYVFAAAFMLSNEKFLLYGTLIFGAMGLVAFVLAYLRPKSWLTFAILVAVPTEILALWAGISVTAEGKSGAGWIVVGASGVFCPLIGAKIGRRIRKPI